MRLRCGLGLSVACLAALCAPARADVATAPAPVFSAVPAFGADALCCDLSLPVAPAVPDGQAFGTTEPRNRLTLPPSPNSATLCLWALGGLGLWQLSRNSRRLQAAWHVPDWYHTGGPRQIGHATPWNPFGSVVCAVNVLDLPLGLKPAAVPMRGVQRDPLRPSSCPIVPADPRGPPAA